MREGDCCQQTWVLSGSHIKKGDKFEIPFLPDYTIDSFFELRGEVNSLIVEITDGWKGDEGLVVVEPGFF